MRLTMSKEKHVIPAEDDMVNQSNVVSQASYLMPVVARRLVFLAMAQVRNDDATRTFTMPVSAVLKSLGMSNDRGPEIADVTDKLMKEILHVKTARGWLKHHWVDEAEYIERGDDVTLHTLSLTLSSRIIPFARTLQKSFHQFKIADIARLSGKYSVRIFELVSSQMGLAGKGGNHPGKWFYEVSVEELRHLFKIEKGEYKRAPELRRNAVDVPVSEINKADLGLKITMEYKYYGRPLVGFRFNCELTQKGEMKVANPKPATKTEAEDDALRTLNPELYALHLKFAEDQTDLGLAPRFPEVEALAALKADPKAVKPTARKVKIAKGSAGSV
jgi:hypothetical protein